MAFLHVCAVGACLGAAEPPPTRASLPSTRFSEAIQLDANAVPSLHGAAQSELSLFACRPTCAPIPWQLDERDAAGRFALDYGPEPTADTPAYVLDDNDVILFMASDAGVRATLDGHAAGLPQAATAAVKIELSDPRTAWRGWVYLLRFAHGAPQSAVAYVHYDPAIDRITGARVALGFENGTPRFLGLMRADGRAPDNLLDRMKVRASARFLWGLVAVERTEDDVQSQFVAWRQGPIRVIRRQRLWVRLGWGLRTPIFGSDTYFYRDFAELPVSLQLNFAPRVLFAGIEVHAVLDFRDLGGWEIETPAPGGAVLGNPRARITGHMTAEKRALSRHPGEWFALRGPDVTLLNVLAVSPSLASVDRRLVYRESAEVNDPPESQRGEMPGIGYTLTRWGRIGSGAHWFASNSYALPPEQDVAEFLVTLQRPLRIRIRLLRG